MKKGCWVFCSLLLLALPAAASAASLAWDAPTEGQVQGYRIYIDDMATPAAEVPAGETRFPLQDLVIGQRYLVGVSAYNAAGESPQARVQFVYQEDLTIEIPPRPLTIKIDWGDTP